MIIEKEFNWAGNFVYSATQLHYPETVEQVQEVVRAASKVKVLGSRHSFNNIADSAEDLISLEKLNRIASIDHERHTVTVGGGIRYGQLCEALEREGYALPNLASLPHISVAGACATATHGSGNHNTSLATSVSAMKIVVADGTEIMLSRDQDGDLFQGAVVGLGGLGVVTQLTLDLLPSFQIQQNVYENLSLDQMEVHFEEITSSAYSVSFFTDWRNEMIKQVWLKRQVIEGSTFEVPVELFGATAAPTHRHPIYGVSAINCTEQMGIPGVWYERLPHFRLAFTPSAGEEIQSEYLVPRRYAQEAVRAVSSLSDHISPLIQVSEVRMIAADTLWMSPFYNQPCVGFHFTWLKNWPAVQQVLPLLEEKLAPFNARPHWGKLFTMPAPQVQALYEKLPDFQGLLNRCDPQGKFRNAFLDSYIYPPAHESAIR